MRLVIYVIDDMWAVAAATASMLRKVGHQVEVETDPAAAERMLLSDAQIDVTFLDLVMPDLNGSEIYKACEEHAPARCERIIFLTGYGDLAPAWMKTSGRLTLEKPCGAEKLVRAAEEVGRLTSPRGPRYPDMNRRDHSALGPQRAKAPSLKDIDWGDDDDVSSVTAMAMNGDVLAVKINHHQEKFEGMDKRMSALEQHFHPETGMVTKMAKSISNAEFWVRSLPFVILIVSALAGAITYVVHTSEREKDTDLLQKVLDAQKTPPLPPAPVPTPK